MKDCRETHAWFDGEHWTIYTERPAEARRFAKWFGQARVTSRDKDGKPRAWTWAKLPARSMRVAARRTKEAAAWRSAQGARTAAS